MAQVKIMARKNGPFRVEAPEGSIELVDADGHKYDLTGKANFALCRCGGSVKSLQPALPLRRRGNGQNAFDAGHRSHGEVA